MSAQIVIKETLLKLVHIRANASNLALKKLEEESVIKGGLEALEAKGISIIVANP